MCIITTTVLVLRLKLCHSNNLRDNILYVVLLVDSASVFRVYIVSPSPWTYPSSGCCSLAVVAVHLKLCCSLCCSPEYLQNAFFVLICKSRRRISCNMPYVIDSPRSIELERSPWFRARLAQYWIIRPNCQMEHLPPLALDPCLIYDTDEGMAAGSGTSLPPPWSIRPTSTGPLSDLRYMFRQTKEWRQAAEPAYSPYQLQYMYGNGPVILNTVVMWYSPAI